MERRDRAGIAVFMAQAPLVPGTNCTLGPDEARHIRVRRLDVGAAVGLRDGQGTVAEGVLLRSNRQGAVVEVSSASVVPPLPPVHLLVPVADRDRLLWLAEKAAELACTSWRPVLWKRSRSVSPRGEGVTFQGKVRARMGGALTQSRGAWLPQLFPEATIDRAVQAAPEGTRLVLHPDGVPLVGPQSPLGASPTTIAVGPEGGFESDELDVLREAGFVAASLGPSILRFETAAVVALGAARAAG